MVKDLVYCDDHRLVFEVGRRGGVITKAPFRHTFVECRGDNFRLGTILFLSKKPFAKTFC